MYLLIGIFWWLKDLKDGEWENEETELEYARIPFLDVFMQVRNVETKFRRCFHILKNVYLIERKDQQTKRKIIKILNLNSIEQSFVVPAFLSKT